MFFEVRRLFIAQVFHIAFKYRIGIIVIVALYSTCDYLIYCTESAGLLVVYKKMHTIHGETCFYHTLCKQKCDIIKLCGSIFHIFEKQMV